MELVFENSFVVMPAHSNYMAPMIFGGKFMAELDLCAASCVTRLIRSSNTVDRAVTYKYEGSFHTAAEVGDIVFMRAEVVELRHKAVVVNVEAHRERRHSDKRDHVASAKFVFITKLGDEYKPHGLVLGNVHNNR